MKVLPVVKDDQTIGWMITCPACGNGHMFDIKRWTFNGNVDSPTFHPSMLVRSTKPDPNAPEKDIPTVCHSFVTDGKIQFLSDCTHELKNQTVPLPDWRV
jgi:hypothetical protein